MVKVPTSERSGLVISAAVHAAVLVGTLVAFSEARTFEDAQESIPVEIVTDSEVNQIMRGERDAEKVEEKPAPRVDTIAETEQQKPQPPTPDARRDVPTPPPPLQRVEDPGEAEPAPQVAAVTPPPRPEPPKPEPPRPEPPKPEPQPAPKAEEEPKPAPPEKAEAEPVPTPPRRPPELKVAETRPEPPKPEPPKVDQVARLLEQKKLEEQKAAARPKSGDEQQQPRRRYDPSDISRLLSKEAPQRTGSTGREAQRTASLGSQTANAPSMSPSLWGQLDGLLTAQYKQCWSNPSAGGGPIYVPQIRVIYNQDGSLAQAPVLVNPPSDPMLRSVAESAMRAVRMCDPLRIPAQYAPYYQQWRARTLRFDPAEMG